MKLPARQLMAKAIFAVAVVATTATAGVVGFAQAARPATLQNGYGGQIDQLIAAVNEFRRSVQTATRQYRQDVDACLVGPPQAASNRAEPHGKIKEAKDKFSHRLDATVGSLNARVGDGRSAQQGSGAFDRSFQDATGQAFSEISGAEQQLAAELGTTAQAAAASDGSLFDCLDQARDRYQQALDEAKAKLLEAIRRILG
jgi:hypothetical protein